MKNLLALSVLLAGGCVWAAPAPLVKNTYNQQYPLWPVGVWLLDRESEDGLTVVEFRADGMYRETPAHGQYREGHWSLDASDAQYRSGTWSLDPWDRSRASASVPIPAHEGCWWHLRYDRVGRSTKDWRGRIMRRVKP